MTARSFWPQWSPADALILGGPIATLAQDRCQALLQDGLFDTNITVDNRYAADIYSSTYCSQSSSNLDTNANVGLPIEGIPVNFGGTDNYDKSENMCDDKASSFEAWQKFRNWSRTASPVLAKAFVDCTNANGVHLWTQRSRVANVFTIYTKVVEDTVNYPPVCLRFSFSPPNLFVNAGQ
jgi:hypothetical protein